MNKHTEAALAMIIDGMAGWGRKVDGTRREYTADEIKPPENNQSPSFRYVQWLRLEEAVATGLAERYSRMEGDTLLYCFRPTRLAYLKATRANKMERFDRAAAYFDCVEALKADGVTDERLLDMAGRVYEIMDERVGTWRLTHLRVLLQVAESVYGKPTTRSTTE